MHISLQKRNLHMFLLKKYIHFHFPSCICCLEHIEINDLGQKSTLGSYIRSEVDSYSSGKPEAKKVDKKLHQILIQEAGA